MAMRAKAVLIGRSRPHRKIINGRRDCVTGIFTSAKPAPGYRTFEWEGETCEKVILKAEMNPNVVSYEVEAPPFQWSDGETLHTYYPDVALQMKDGTRLCVEAKHSSHVKRHNLVPLYKQVALSARQAGYSKFALMTEKDFTAVEIANARLICSEIGPLDDAEEGIQLLFVMDRLGGRATIRTLRAASGLGKRSFRAVVRLIAQRKLEVSDRDQLIDDRLVVFVP